MDDKNILENIKNNEINNNEISLNKKENFNNTEEKKSFFLMTLEDSMGKCQEIKIYQNSNPSELAYNFCKENNLDFNSMEFIKSNIKSVVENFNEPLAKSIFYNKSNNSIKEEEDEDDYLTERSERSNEKPKVQEEEKDNYLKDSDVKNKINNSNDKNKIINNNDNNNIQDKAKQNESKNKNNIGKKKYNINCIKYKEQPYLKKNILI